MDNNCEIYGNIVNNNGVNIQVKNEQNIIKKQNGRLTSFFLYITLIIYIGTISYIFKPSFLCEVDVNKKMKESNDFVSSKKKKPCIKKMLIFSSITSLIPVFLSTLFIKNKK